MQQLTISRAKALSNATYRNEENDKTTRTRRHSVQLTQLRAAPPVDAGYQATLHKSAARSAPSGSSLHNVQPPVDVYAATAGVRPADSLRLMTAPMPARRSSTLGMRPIFSLLRYVHTTFSGCSSHHTLLQLAGRHGPGCLPLVCRENLAQ